MKIYFNHYTGRMTDYDYLFFDCFAEVAEEEEDIALEEGWIPDDYTLPREESDSRCPFPWYQARQTRIKIKDFKDDARTRKTRRRCTEVTTQIIDATHVDEDILLKIFNEYVSYKNFATWDILRLIKSNLKRKKFILYSYENTVVAYTLLREAGNSLLSTQFAWDYEKPQLYLGKYSTLAEVDYCISMGKDALYIGAGYENCCAYKGEYPGFEFWNGRVWSNDTSTYKYLCDRDSSLERLSELERCKKEDDKKFFTSSSSWGHYQNS